MLIVSAFAKSANFRDCARPPTPAPPHKGEGSGKRFSLSIKYPRFHRASPIRLTRPITSFELA